VLLSTAIEVVQLRIPGRATDVDDVIFNTLGALVGASALLVGERVRARRAARG
jgi:glycopeptide antibiotics resistance protein